MRRLVSRFEGEADQERRTIARRLHDDIGQDLTLLVFALDQLKRSLGDANREELVEAQEIAGDLIAKVRDISHQVRPPIPERVGLLSAVEAFLNEFAGKTGIDVDFSHSGMETELRPHMASAIFLIVQRAATYLHNDSRSMRVAIRITARSAIITVTARNGPGAESAPQSHDDLQWILDRSKYLGGTSSLTTSSGSVTRIAARLPLR